LKFPKEPQEKELRGKRRKRVSTIEQEKAFVLNTREE
jgi:hypothetical protein